jgi:hypothetical protein
MFYIGLFALCDRFTKMESLLIGLSKKLAKIESQPPVTETDCVPASTSTSLPPSHGMKRKAEEEEPKSPPPPPPRPRSSTKPPPPSVRENEEEEEFAPPPPLRPRRSSKRHPEKPTPRRHSTKPQFEEEEKEPASPPLHPPRRYMPVRPQKKVLNFPLGPGRWWVWKEKQRLLEEEKARILRFNDARSHELHQSMMNNVDSYAEYLDAL